MRKKDNGIIAEVETIWEIGNSDKPRRLAIISLSNKYRKGSAIKNKINKN